MLGYLYNNSHAAGLANTQLRATSQTYNITDAWKARPNLTVNVGLRYEFVPPWSERRPNRLNAYVPLNAAVRARRREPVIQANSPSCEFGGTLRHAGASLRIITGLLVCGAMIYGLGWTNWARLGGWLIVGLIMYFLYGRKHSRLAADEAGVGVKSGA